MDLLSWIVVIVIGIWLLGLILRIGGKLIHLLLVIGLILLVLRFFGVNL